MQDRDRAAIDLYWIPLGAGGHCVRFNGRVFEAIAAAREHRPRCDLYDSALVVEVDGERHAIEIAPSPDADLAQAWTPLRSGRPPAAELPAGRRDSTSPGATGRFGRSSSTRV